MITVFAIKIRGKVFVVELPALYPPCALSAKLAVEFEVVFINAGEVEVSDEVVFEHHPVVKLLAVRL